MKNNTFPPFMNDDDKVILFDGICKLCNAWSQFIIKYDTNKIFKLASVQSPEGQAILRHFEMPTEYFDTMLYVEGRRSFEKSEAFLAIIKQLNLPWKAMAVFRILPLTWRDWCYDRVALNRYQLFGQFDQCLIPASDHDKRFLP